MSRDEEFPLDTRPSTLASLALFSRKATEAAREETDRKISMKRTMINKMICAEFVCLLGFAHVYAQTDPLPSWNDGPAKKAIVELVKRTTEKGSPKFGSDWQLRFQVQSLFPK